MICELCGTQVSEASKIRIEGSVITACVKCRGAGEVVEQVNVRKKTPPKRIKPKEKPKFEASTEFDLVDEFHVKIRKSREKQGWTQEELGMMVNEPHSLINRIELGKFEPAPDIIKKLERKLDIKLRVPHREIEIPNQKMDYSDVTLGDMVVIRKRDK